MWQADTLTSNFWPPERGKNEFLLLYATQFVVLVWLQLAASTEFF